jgi:hypothetical protein
MGVRCAGAEQALKAADLLVQSGGWGVVVLDLGSLSPQTVRRLPISYWYRFRRAVENTPTVFVVLEREPFVKNCAAMSLELGAARPVWSGSHRDYRVLRGLEVQMRTRKPPGRQGVAFRAKALA